MTRHMTVHDWSITQPPTEPGSLARWVGVCTCGWTGLQRNTGVTLNGQLHQIEGGEQIARQEAATDAYQHARTARIHQRHTQQQHHDTRGVA